MPSDCAIPTLEDYEAAEKDYQACVSHIELTRAGIYDSFHRTEILGGAGWGAYSRIVKLLAGPLRHSARAYDFVERAKARTFLEQLGDIPLPLPSGMDPVQYHAERALAGRLQSLSTARGGKTITWLNLSTDTETARQEWNKILDGLKITFPDYVALRRGEPVRFVEIIQFLSLS